MICSALFIYCMALTAYAGEVDTKEDSYIYFDMEQDIYANETGSAKLDMVAILPDDATGSLNWTFGGFNIISPIIDGKALVKIDEIIQMGRYTIYARYGGDEKYSGCNNSTAVTVHYLPITISGDNVTVSYNEVGHRINISVLDPKEGATVLYGDVPDNCTMEESPIFVTPGLYECYYEVSAPYRETRSGVAYINISQIPTSMKLEVERDVFTDENGTACFDMVAKIPENATGNVTWSFDGKEYISEIEDGKAVATINGVLESGNHTVYAEYEGDDSYYGCSNSTAVTVHYLPITVSANDVRVTYDDRQHGIDVAVLDPKEGATVRYGRTRDNCTMESSPTLKKPGTMEVFYEVSAPYRETCYGSANITIDPSHEPEPEPDPEPIPEPAPHEEEKREQSNIARDELAELINTKGTKDSVKGIYQAPFDDISTEYSVKKGKITKVVLDLSSLKEGENHLTMNTGTRLVLSEGFTVSDNFAKPEDYKKVSKALKNRKKSGWSIDLKKLSGKTSYEIVLVNENNKNKLLVIDVIDLSLNRKSLRTVDLSKAVGKDSVSKNAVSETLITDNGYAENNGVVTISTSPVLRTGIPGQVNRSARFISGIWMVGNRAISRGTIETVTRGKVVVHAKVNSDGSLSIGKADGSGKGSVPIRYILNGKVNIKHGEARMKSKVYNAKIKVQ